MSFSKEFIDFGVLKIDGKNRLRIYKSQYSFINITVSEEIKDYRWTGDTILIYLKSGKVRKYNSPSNYITI
jgi:hypothetical protein